VGQGDKGENKSTTDSSWQTPEKQELHKLHKQKRYINVVGGFKAEEVRQEKKTRT
jgi:hypothetical protein